MSSPDLLLILPKMAIAAAIVVSVSIIAEKSKPFIAAMVATLPVSAGPALVFLALDQNDAFMQQTLLASMVTNLATCAYCLAHAATARRAGTSLTLLVALLTWVGTALMLKSFTWNLPMAVLATLAVFPLAIRASRPFLAVARPPVPPRAWYAIPLRAAGVSLLVAVITTLSSSIGPQVSGLLAVSPVVLSSLTIILQPRIGGRATGMLMVSGLPGLWGFGFALAIAILLVPIVGRFGALGMGLGMCLLWNGALVLMSQRNR